MISHKHKFIFVHIPKSGGTSIERVLNNGESVKRFKHLPAKIFKRRFSNGFKAYFKFSIVRNPWDRILSYYFWRKNTAGTRGYRRFYSGNKSFDEWFKHIVLEVKKGIGNPGLLMNVDTQYNSLTIGGEDVLDFVGRYETLQEDFNTVCDRIKIPRKKLPHNNKTNHKPYWEYYDDEMQKLVAEYYKKDIEHFGYKFGKD